MSQKKSVAAPSTSTPQSTGATLGAGAQCAKTKPTFASSKSNSKKSVIPEKVQVRISDNEDSPFEAPLKPMSDKDVKHIEEHFEKTFDIDENTDFPLWIDSFLAIFGYQRVITKGDQDEE